MAKNTKRMRVLVIDIGGTNVKIFAMVLGGGNAFTGGFRLWESTQ